ncbi:kinesin-like protein [Plakobranchus ocellatus]|uniref:Kinesin-like protein n=1 Tax=Plakobranchus ocellatus TaxID=259542 RepID=A0AAV4DVG7_9GAST|nr:kinesin-like protein [Plakobranchus ocellatus]
MADHSQLTQSAKRTFNDLQDTCVRRPKDDISPPYKKKRTKLVDLFKNRASISTADECTKVFLRVKPSSTEDEDYSQKCLQIIPEENAVLAVAPDSSHAHKSLTRGLGKSSLKFTFSQIFDENTTQAEFFSATMLDMTKQFIGGQNSLVFSYGVTSSGKTYTIQGKPQDAGILPRSLDVLFNSIEGKQISNPRLKPEMFNGVVRLSADEVLTELKIKKQTLKMGVVGDLTVMSMMGNETESQLSDTAMSSSSNIDEILAEVVNRDRIKLTVDVEERLQFGVWVSFAEVYNEHVYDLLVPVPHQKKAKRQTLRICDDRYGNPYIKGLKEIHVESADEAYKLLAIGQRNLKTACTRLNHCSSRSHSIFNIKIVRVVDKEDPHIACVSTLSLCDLAGSERYSKTQATGDRLKEAGNINTSLMTLGRCIETLRHNQLHRDQQRLVPFRDSKVTRILQNFFNGFGKAVMIVNVSQAASMFDDTLHVFKFSAIAKQVKYEKPPEDKKAPKEKRADPASHRQTIAWETQETKAQSVFDSDDDIDEELVGSENLSDIDEMRKYIESLELRNERLTELVADEMRNAEEREKRIRKEVVESMQKQMVIIEESYSAMLKDAIEDGEEMADERAKGIMEVYERRLERIQTKVDEEDEWVSSLLFYQEKAKVEERDAKIAELEKQTQELQKKPVSVDDTIDMGNTVLVETLTQKLQDAKDENDSKINELKLLLEEAGEAHMTNMEEIKTLKENLTKERKNCQLLTLRVTELEKLVSEAKKDEEKALKVLSEKETELQTSQEDLHGKLKSKDATISSLEEECKELQEEIERLQDQMSQLDEQSRLQRDLESSAASEKNNKSTNSFSNLEGSLHGDMKSFSPQLKLGKENICDVDTLTKVKQRNKELMDDIASVKNELENRQKEIVLLKAQNTKLEFAHTASMTEKDAISKDLDICKQSFDKISKELEMKQEVSDQSANELIKTKEELNEMKNNFDRLQEQNSELVAEKQQYETALAELKIKVRELEETSESLKATDQTNKTIEITQMVQLIEEKASPLKSCKTLNQEEEEDDDEIVFNLKTEEPTVSQTPNKQTRPITPSPNEPECADLAVKLKDAELVNAALRSKLKHEEEDYFKREQALIHGYTAEIDSLKYELAKFRAKVDDVAGGKQQRGKKRALMDTSSSSSISESYCESGDVSNPKRLHKAVENPEQAQSVAVLSSEVVFLQEQLASLAAAYRALNTEAKGSDFKTINEETKCMPKAARYSSEVSVSAAPRYSLTNSVLLFEKEEYAIKFEEMSNQVLQLEAEVKSLTCQLEKCRETAGGNDQDKTGGDEVGSSDGEPEMEKVNVKIQILTQKLEDAHKKNAEIEKALEEAKDKQAELETKDSQIQVLEEKCKDLEKIQVLTQELEDAFKKNAEIEKALEEAKNKQNDLETKACQIQILEEKCRDLEGKCKDLEKIQVLNQEIEDAHKKNAETEKALEEAKVEHAELETKTCQIQVLEEKCRDLEAKCIDLEAKCKDLENLQILNQELEDALKRNAEIEKALEEAKDKQKELETREGQIHVLEGKREYLEKNLSESEKIVKQSEERLHALEDQLSQISSQLEEKCKELAQVETLRQEEAAEVAQKLISLERQKKLAERRAAEACDREEDTKLKFQGYERAKEDVEKLQKQLERAALEMKEEKTLNAKLADDLSNLSEEKQDAEHLKSKLSNLQQQVEMECHAKQLLTKEKEELLEKMDELKMELLESEKTMDQQEDVLTKQDEEIKDLKTELQSLKQECDKLDKTLTRRDLELANLNKQISKSSEEVKNLDDIKSHNHQLQEVSEKTKSDLKNAEQELERIKSTMEEMTENKKVLETELQTRESIITKNKEEMEVLEKEKQKQESINKKNKEEKEALEKDIQKQESINKKNKQEMEVLEKELQKQESINKRNKEEMEHWKSERDACVKRLEQCINKMAQEKEQLSEEVLEKELQKQESINKRNKEEMEHWKSERDACVKRLEQCINKMAQEKEQLSEEIEKLKKSNAELAQDANNISRRKDALISELKKSNNTMSIQLADAQGLSPPPKMATPEMAFPGQLNFEEDNDTSGHIEIDVTPNAARRGKKRHTSRLVQSAASSSVDPEATPEPKCLKTIKEEAESPLNAAGKSPRNRVVELASEVIATLSPLTRSSAKKQSTRNKGKKSSIQPPFETAAFGNSSSDLAQTESSMRRSSRLRKQTSKHSLV